MRTVDGVAWVVTFNRRPRGKAAFRSDVDRTLMTAKGKVWKWPDGDLFPRFEGGTWSR